MRQVTLFILATLVLSVAVYAQNPPASPAAPGAGAPKQAAAASAASQIPASALGGNKIAVVDFGRCVTETEDGKVIGGKIDAEGKKRQVDYDAKKAKGEELTKQLQTDTKLTEVQKNDMARQINTLSTDMDRINQDWQRDLGEMQQTMFAPVAAKVSEAIKAYANENGIAVVFDNSGQASNIIFALDVADITTEIIRRVNTMKSVAPATPARPPAPSAAPGGTARPAGGAGAPATGAPAPTGARPGNPPVTPNKPPPVR